MPPELADALFQQTHLLAQLREHGRGVGYPLLLHDRRTLAEARPEGEPDSVARLLVERISAGRRQRVAMLDEATDLLAGADRAVVAETTEVPLAGGLELVRVARQGPDVLPAPCRERGPVRLEAALHELPGRRYLVAQALHVREARRL